MRAKAPVGVMVLAAMAITCAGASAATYCVPAHVGCSGLDRATLASAVTDANATVESDDIYLGRGTFAGGVSIGAYPVHIHGVTTDDTRIEGGGGTYAVYMGQASSSIEDLTIHELAGGQPIGLYLAGSAQRVVVDLRDNPTDSSIAVALYDDGSFVDGAALNSLATTLADTGLAVSGTGDALVSGVQAQGRYAVTTAGTGIKTLRFIRANGNVYGVNASADDTLIDDSVVSGAPVVGYLFGGSNDIVTTLRHVTLNGTYAGAESNNHTSKLVLSNTAVVGGGPDPETPDIELSRSSTGTARVEADYSFFRAAHVIYAAGPGIQYAPGAHNIDGAEARVVNLAAGDLRLRFDSPLVDTGDPVPGGGEPMADLAGEFRAVNGRTDIGAYEYGRHAPAVDAVLDPTFAFVGDSVRFAATPTDADPGEVPVVTWAFDDGSTASGASVTHAFATPGTHVATATATDPTGLTASASVSVPISPSAPTPKAIAPKFLFGKLKARKGVVGVALSCPLLATDCKGTVELRLAAAPKAKGNAAKVMVLGRARYAIARGTHKTIRVKLTKSARRRLARARHPLYVKVVAQPKGAAARSKAVRLSGR
jgi:hypothetical protein